METDPAFVRPDRRIHLDSEAAVHLNFSFVVHPWNAENDSSFGLCHTLQKFHPVVLLFSRNKRYYGDCHFFYGLKEFGLIWVSRLYFGYKILDFLFCVEMFHIRLSIIVNKFKFFFKTCKINFLYYKNINDFELYFY